MSQHLPSSHDQMIHQAFYNVVACVILIALGAISLVSYHIMVPFLKPLMWAVLLGSALFPAKRRLTVVTEQWLRDLEQNSLRTPLLIGALVTPLAAADSLVCQLCSTALRHFRPLFVMVVSMTTVNLLCANVPQLMLRLSIWLFRDVAVGNLLWLLAAICHHKLLCCSCVLAYLLAVSLFWSRVNCVYSVPVWLLVLGLLSGLAGSVAGPVFVSLVALLTLGVAAEVRQQPCATAGFGSQLIRLRSIVLGSEHWAAQQGLSSESSEGAAADGVLSCSTTGSTTGSTTAATTAVTSGSSTGSTTVHIVRLFYACLLVIVWQRIWLLSTLPVLILYYLLRQLVVSFWRASGRDVLLPVAGTVSQWLDVRRDALLPLPIRGACKMVLGANSRLVDQLRSSLHGVVTVLVMMSSVVLIVFVAVFASAQIYRETVHMVQFSSSLLNSTIVTNSQLHALLPNNTEELLQQTLDNGYSYGRKYICQTLRSLVDGVDAETAHSLESFTLDLWDRVYQWSVSSVVTQPAIGPVVSSDSVLLAGQEWLQFVKSSSQLLNFNSIQMALRSNLDVVMSVVDSVTGVVKANVYSLVTLVTYFVTLLLGGGFFVIGIVINLVVFLTALFYLLSSSDKLYLPLELFSRLLPIQSGRTRVIEAVDEIVSGVFVASLKMAVFYFLWTWLVHSVFCVKFVYLSSVAAAVLAAVPFLGSYWAALPAVLELWLLHEMPYSALCLVAAQMAPMLSIDSAIYSEVKGCHPYLTGLAIAGGIMCLGFEGAFLGPLLLCCLLLTVRLCSDMSQWPITSVHRLVGVSSQG